MSRFFKSAAFPILIVVVLAFFAQRLISPSDHQKDPLYSQFLQQVDDGRVKQVTLNTKNNRIDVELGDGKKYQTAYPDNTEQNLVNQLRAENIPIDVEAKGGSGWLTALTYILPFVIFLLFWLFIINQMQGGARRSCPSASRGRSGCRWIRRRSRFVMWLGLMRLLRSCTRSRSFWRIRRSFRRWGRGFRRVCFCMGRLGRGRRCWRGRWPVRRGCRSSRF